MNNVWHQLAAMLEKHGSDGIGAVLTTAIHAADAAGDLEAGRGWFAIVDALQELDGRAIN